MNPFPDAISLNKGLSVLLYPIIFYYIDDFIVSLIVSRVRIVMLCNQEPWRFGKGRRNGGLNEPTPIIFFLDFK